MASHPTGRERASQLSWRERKSTQRERLLAGMLHSTLREGYAKASITQTIVHAGVSRPTFYDYFSDKDDCFVTLCEQIGRRVVARTAAAVRAKPPERAVQAAIEALVGFAQEEPEQARFLMGEAPGGGPPALDRRDRAIDRIETVIRSALAQAAGDAPVPDIPLHPLIGGMHWLLATQLRRGNRELSRLSEDMDSWLEAYIRPLGSHRWNALQPEVAAPPSTHVAELSLRAPSAVPPGRTKLSQPKLAANQRERILFGIIEVVAVKGYATTTIADITTAAHVDRRVFYSHFRDKQHAFLTIHELAFQQTMAVTAGAFFGGASWPERVWEGLLAFAHFQAQHPTLAHMGFVDSYTVGSDAVRRVEDSRAAFTLFLQEGYLNASPPPPRIAMDAIAATISELGYHLVRRGKTQLFPCLMGHSTAVALTPFLGAQPTIEFIERKLSEQPEVG